MFVQSPQKVKTALILFHLLLEIHTIKKAVSCLEDDLLFCTTASIKSVAGAKQ